MPRIKIEDLEKIKQKVRETTSLREGGQYRVKINVHMGTCGIAAGARKVLTAIMEEIDKRGLKDVMVMTSGCAGLCSREPMMTVEMVGQPAPVKYCDLDENKVKEIIEEHIVGGKIVEKYALARGSETTL